ncbi:unnamed protein product [marine sediment metagenome]|uniref:RNA polymerase sigma-70 region 4 domain-containing protein n=1 Tax=marine sediment metagenome TaxID=412755 RepID=X1PNC8_9ZZZZ
MGSGLINEVHSQKFNERDRRVGHIFGGKIKKEPLGDERIYVAHVWYGYTLRQIGEFLGVHYSTVGKALKKAKGRK